MTASVRPFVSAVPDEAIEDLRRRLRNTRWPEREPVSDWSQGMPLAVTQALCAHWASGYDWRAAERRLNAVPQFLTRIDGLDIHFLHARSPHTDARPLVLTHGWPGSVFDFVKVVGPLTDPTRFGGSSSDAFHVVCPSLPGYGFSGRPERAGWGIERIARAWMVLMERLGYDRFGAQGGDWGTSITTLMAQLAPGRLSGILLTPPLAAPDPATLDDLTPAERSSLAALEHAREWEDGYSAEHSTKPQTIGYALDDSPAALCAWIVEKYASWSDGEGLSAFTDDELLDNLSLYWFTGTGASSVRLYWESIRTVQGWFSEAVVDTVGVPTGCSIFPAETIRPSRRWAEKRFTDIRWWSEPPRGGHFAALEQPELFVDEIRAFFDLVR